MDSDLEALYVYLRYHLNQRSLLILFTILKACTVWKGQLPT
jgi:hypothetical protein